MTRFYIILILFSIILLQGCYNNQQTEGNYNFPNKIAQLKIGLSKAKVIELLGAETIKSSFDENTIYYIYEISNRPLKFFNKGITDSLIIIINYDSKNVVKKIDFRKTQDRIHIPYDKDTYQSSLAKSKLIDDDLKDIDALK
jgi:outer membrane protein assembly factor BamE (lipoprotein component of BamABCDE complex)